MSPIEQRWIIAGENMKIGDIIKSHGEIPDIPINPRVGDSHPVGALPVGTLLHNIEEIPNIGGGLVRAAGSFASIQRRLEDGIVVRLPSGQEAKLDFRCRATIGKVCLPERNLLPIGSAKRSRWFGIRPRSGLFHKKTGYHGRKLSPPKPVVTFEKRTKDRVYEMFDV
ncbi:RM02-like protein [Mya arenaria]|uniref:RM02-like protein n=1 Tax=Mya arenaria TaxID=6604 RepID=A0ABY7FYJ8_MYAAR|nr:RM02-like protein [Mya arenaria]